MLTVTGDIHGELSRFDISPIRRLKRGDSLIVCGDFGFIWNGDESEQKALKKLSKKKYNILFVDGAHENFDLLKKYPEQEFNGGKVRKIADNIFWLLRGQVFTLEGKTIFTFGGGESDDKAFRKEANKWWEYEMPTIDEMNEGVTNLYKHNLRVDYIITHSPFPGAGRNLSTHEKNPLETYFEELVKSVSYKEWYFGSLHIDKPYTPRNHAVFSEVIPLK